MTRSWFGIALFVVACSANRSTSTVGPNGGTVAVGSVVVAIPAGALSSSVGISVAETNAPAPIGTVIAGPSYVLGPEGTQFAKPVSVTLRIAGNRLPQGTTLSDVVVYTAPASSTHYEMLPTSVADADDIRATTTHFSVFVPAVATKESNRDAGVDAAVSDMNAVARDLSQSLLGDLNGSDDAAIVCTPTISGTSSNCTVSASCNGHSYEMRCANGACTCFVDGISGKNGGNVGVTCASSNGQPTWSQLCNFP